MGGDRELVAACVRGDRQAWVRLVREHDRKVLQVLYRLGAREELDDLRQEVWARLLARDAAALRGFRAERAGALRIFVGKVAQTVAIDFLRAHRAGEALPEELPDPAPDPEQVLGDEQRRRRLLSALERVSGEAENPARDRDILRLHYQEGYSAAEIAEMGIGLSARGVEAVLRRAKARIEELLRES